MTKKEFIEQFKKEKIELGVTISDDECYVCCQCGSLDIEEKYWVNINTNEISSETDESNYYCNTCDRPYEGFTYTKDEFIKFKTS